MDSVLAVREVEGRKVLGCRACAGAFVGATFGLRLLAVLDPEVPPVRVGMPSPACPVCRQGMRRVVGGGVEVETCKTHGVWFDAGDLPKLVRAVAKALGKAVPASLEALEARTPASEPADARSERPSAAPVRRPYTPSTGEQVLGAISGAVDVVTDPIEAVVDVVMFPFEVVSLLGELLD